MSAADPRASEERDGRAEAGSARALREEYGANLIST